MGNLLMDDTFQQMTTKENALLQVLVSDKISNMYSNWASVQRIVRNGYAPNIYRVGDQFTDTWTDTAASSGSGQEYTYPWHIADFRDATLQNGEIKPGIILQAHYAHPFGIQFSHQRAFLKCPDGLPIGTYYFTIESTLGSNVSAGDTVSFTTAKEVPAGGCVAGCYNAPDQAKSNWKIYTYNSDHKTVIETLTPTFESSGTSLGTQKIDTRNDNLNSTREMSYGWNRWSTSALRQYLNSDKTKGNWWTAQDEWDIAPNELSTKDGFLCGMPQELLDVIKPVKITTYTNTVQDGGTADITYDKVFIPALQEIYINPQIDGEGEYWEYWKQVAGTTEPLAQYGTYPQMITYAVENHNSAQIVRLRSAYRSFASHAWSVYSSGYVVSGNGSASNAYRFAPACVIC